MLKMGNNPGAKCQDQEETLSMPSLALEMVRVGLRSRLCHSVHLQGNRSLRQ